jgi:putative methionine-R-sulfoxide reductase with GAF domain
MSRDLSVFRATAWDAFTSASRAAIDAPDAESALLKITGASKVLLGDKDAYLRPGALKEGERHYSISGIFLISGSRRENILIAEDGFPAEQHRLRIPIEHGHPGWVVKQKKPLLLANTDEHNEFQQILKTSRMGSVVFAPLFWKGEMFGQIVTASQARNTYSDADLTIQIAFADLAAAAFVAHGGTAALDRLE